MTIKVGAKWSTKSMEALVYEALTLLFQKRLYNIEALIAIFQAVAIPYTPQRTCTTPYVFNA